MSKANVNILSTPYALHQSKISSINKVSFNKIISTSLNSQKNSTTSIQRNSKLESINSFTPPNYLRLFGCHKQ